MDSRQDGNGPKTNAGEHENRVRYSSSSAGRFFVIRVRGHLDSKWADWLEGLEVELLENGEMLLSGDIVDQAALMGVLNRLYRLNLALLSVNEIRPGDRSKNCER